MRSVTFAVIILLFFAYISAPSILGGEDPIPPDSFLQDKVLEVGKAMGWSLAYENRGEGLFIWFFKVEPLGLEQAGKECGGFFTWYIKRVGNHIALDDPVVFLPGCPLGQSEIRFKATCFQEEFKKRWLDLVGPITLSGATATHSTKLFAEVLARLIKEKIKVPAHTSPAK